MKVIMRKKEKGDPLCKICKYPLDHETNILKGYNGKETIKRYNLDENKHNAWYRCKLCGREYVVGNYTNM